ncbi:MAG: serine--tRNA ligase [Thermoproteota archaeon]|nr:serine--tRNA ligase [Thermoproteota archaeon]MDQ4101099.1 serine--tRNA ligase [Thermoproteota archaeon]
MLDPRILKEKPEAVRDMLKKRNMTDFPLDELIVLYKQRSDVIIKTQELRRKKNLLSEVIASKKRSKEDVSFELGEMKQVSIQLHNIEFEATQKEEKFHQLIMTLPNLLNERVPIGKDEQDNVVVRKFGENTTRDFKSKDHIDLANALDLVDLNRAAKVSGARFYFLKNDLVKLNQALVNFALDFLSRNNYTLIQPPYMIRKEPMVGSIILNDFEDVIYKIENEDLYMIGTSEHAIAGMHMDEIIEGAKLPIRYGGFSSCFRKEAGAHGKDMKGIFRVHQFEKVEQFVYCRPEESEKEHERMLALSEEFFRQIGIPYRVMLLCSGDTGKISSKTYDIEAWMAGQDAYREIVSCSNCLDYQARRLSIRFRDKTNEDTRFVHTLNSTLVATERTMVAIIENFQTPNGNVKVPEVLQKYMGGIEEIQPRH